MLYSIVVVVPFTVIVDALGVSTSVLANCEYAEVVYDSVVIQYAYDGVV